MTTMTDQQKVRVDAFREWDAQDNGVVSRIKVWNAAWQAALAHANSATVEENLTVGESFAEWLEREMPAGTVIGDPTWWSKRIAGRVHLLHTHPAPAAEDARDAGGWREMDSAPIDKAIMGAWFGSSEYTEVSPVIYCSERGKWMNPSDMRDDEYAKPDMWHPYPSAPNHRDVDQALAAERGEA